MKQAIKAKKPAFEPAKRRGNSIEQRKAVDGDLAAIAGLGKFKSTDPVNHIIEHSRGLFDMIGRANALKMAGEEEKEAETDGEEQSEEQDEAEKASKGKNKSEDASENEQSQEEENDDKPGGEFYRKFSEVAFRNGKMLSSVEDGGALTMMTSCISHSISQSPPARGARRGEPQNDTGATRLNVPGSGTDKLIFRKYARGALSLVIETAQNLTMTLSVFESMANGEIDNRMGIAQMETAYRTYPFLNIKPEQDLLKQYNEQIRSLPDGDKKKALEYGVNRLNTIIGHKDHMRVEFHQGLRKAMQNSQEAARLFSLPGTEEEIIELLYEAGEGGNPPSDGNQQGNGAGSVQATSENAEAAEMMGNQNVLNMMDEG